MRYAAIHQHREQHSIARQCRVLKVSRGGYYDWLSRRGHPGRREAARLERDIRIAGVFEARKCRYGSPRIAAELAAEGWTVNRKTVAESMRRQGLRARAARRFKKTTDSNHSLAIAPNRLKQDFSVAQPDQAWAGDITYLRTLDGWLYLAVVLDLCTRRVIGWSTSANIDSELPCSALRAALRRRPNARGAIMHTDRGSVYGSWAHRDLLRRHGLRASMSATGNCYDNPPVESFFHSLKVEMIHGERLVHADRLRSQLFEYIEAEYNRTRRHSALGYVSPDVFEARCVA